jgi:hypothetical protein
MTSEQNLCSFLFLCIFTGCVLFKLINSNDVIWLFLVLSMGCCTHHRKKWKAGGRI